MSKNIAVAYVRFVQTAGGKRRPVYILREDKEHIFFFDITTKYKNKSKNKSKNIKKYYFEIKEYELTGLKRHSWIDTFMQYSLSKKDANINYIGRLSNNDTHGLIKFFR